MSSIQEELRFFATGLLERRGALVEWPAGDEEGTAVLPGPLVEDLGAEDEMVRLSGRPGGEGLCVNLATDFLETAGRLLEAEPRVGTFRVPELYLKRGSLEETVARAFTWHNVKVTTRAVRSLRVEYHTWWFHVCMASEDRWESRFAVTINASSGAEVPLPDPLELWELKPAPRLTADAPSTYREAAARAVPRARQLAAGFLDRMDARLQRDRKRLREYYGALLRETDRKKARGRAQPDPEKKEAKKRAVKLELRRKLVELDERYAVDAALEPLVLVRTELPALAVELTVQRKRARKEHFVYWNALLKQLEPMRCSGCGRGTFSVTFTNEDVEPLCAECAK